MARLPADPSLDCATYPVPLGTLFVNPGGPGDSTFKMTEKIVATFYPGLAARFDMLGMYPRGVGASTPVHVVLREVAATALLPPQAALEYGRRASAGPTVTVIAADQPRDRGQRASMS